MHCPFCGHSETKVIDSRLAGEGRQIRRRRECLHATERFTTFETAELLLPTVIKGDRTREPFDEKKLLAGMQKALEKRPVGREAIEAAVAQHLSQAAQLGRARNRLAQRRRDGDGGAAPSGRGGLRALRVRVPQFPGRRGLPAPRSTSCAACRRREPSQRPAAAAAGRRARKEADERSCRVRRCRRIWRARWSWPRAVSTPPIRTRALAACWCATGAVVGEGWHERAGETACRGAARCAAAGEAGPRRRRPTSLSSPAATPGARRPCADALIAAGVRRVVCLQRRSQPARRGQRLRRGCAQAGIEVASGRARDRGACAQPGFFLALRAPAAVRAPEDGDDASMRARRAATAARRRISRASLARRRAALARAQLRGAHRRRARCAATIRFSTCAWITARAVRQPLRVVLDSDLRTRARREYFQREGPGLCASAPRAARAPAGGPPVETVPRTAGGPGSARRPRPASPTREVNELLVECGATLAGSFLAAGLVDELVLYVAPRLLGLGRGAAGGAGRARRARRAAVRISQCAAHRR